jgi:HEPN domain-containing protein
LENIFKLGCYYSNPVPKSRIPDSIWNAEKLDSVLNKMDLSIKNGEYNLTITYAYSCLEGLYKAFLIERIPEKMHIDKLNQLSKAVRDYLIDYFVKENISYPEQIINLIPTITNAISQARNSFSDSHFDGESEKWLAEFTRDCVNSIGRLIIKFIKE